MTRQVVVRRSQSPTHDDCISVDEHATELRLDAPDVVADLDLHE